MKKSIVIVAVLLALASSWVSAAPADWVLVTPQVAKIGAMILVDGFAGFQLVSNGPSALGTSASLVALGLNGVPSVFMLAALSRGDGNAVRTWRVVSIFADSTLAVTLGLVSTELLGPHTYFGDYFHTLGYVGLTVFLSNVINVIFEAFPFAVENAPAVP
jgi:hypothetical protein